VRVVHRASIGCLSAVTAAFSLVACGGSTSASSGSSSATGSPSIVRAVGGATSAAASAVIPTTSSSSVGAGSAVGTLHAAPSSEIACQVFTAAEAKMVRSDLTNQVGSDSPECSYSGANGDLVDLSLTDNSSPQSIASDRAQVPALGAALGAKVAVSDAQPLGPGAYTTTLSGDKTAQYVGGTTYSVTWLEGSTEFALNATFDAGLAPMLSLAEAIYAAS
jgi:hypothetical protein